MRSLATWQCVPYVCRPSLGCRSATRGRLALVDCASQQRSLIDEWEKLKRFHGSPPALACGKGERATRHMQSASNNQPTFHSSMNSRCRPIQPMLIIPLSPYCLVPSRRFWTRPAGSGASSTRSASRQSVPLSPRPKLRCVRDINESASAAGQFILIRCEAVFASALQATRVRSLQFFTGALPRRSSVVLSFILFPFASVCVAGCRCEAGRSTVG